jgi:hypothetical protein
MHDHPSNPSPLHRRSADYVLTAPFRWFWYLLEVIAIHIESTFLYGFDRRRKRIIDGNAKSLRLNLEKDFAAAVYLSEAPSSPGFSLWGGREFGRL